MKVATYDYEGKLTMEVLASPTSRFRLESADPRCKIPEC